MMPEKTARNEQEEASGTYLFTTATITVFSEKVTALIDLHVNTERRLASCLTAAWANKINSNVFSRFHALILSGRQSPAVELCERD